MSRAAGKSDNASTLRCPAYLELAEPFFPFIGFFLAKCEVNELPIAVLSGGKRNHVLRHMAEIVENIGVLVSSKTLSYSNERDANRIT